VCITAKKKKKKKKETEKEKTKSMTHIYDARFGTSGPACCIGHVTEKKRKDKKKEKRGRKAYRVICFMPLAVQCQWSLCRLKKVVSCTSKL